MSLDLPLSAQIDLIRQKIRDNTVTEEEMRVLIATLRGNRQTAAASKPSGKKSPAVDGDALLDDLLGST